MMLSRRFRMAILLISELMAGKRPACIPHPSEHPSITLKKDPGLRTRKRTGKAAKARLTVGEHGALAAEVVLGRVDRSVSTRA